MLDLVAFDAPSLDTFHEINEELGSIYDIYRRKMELISAFKTTKFNQFMKDVKRKQ